jgi:hypothetical protein
MSDIDGEADARPASLLEADARLASLGEADAHPASTGRQMRVWQRLGKAERSGQSQRGGAVPTGG